MQRHQTSCLALLIANLFSSHDLYPPLTENTMAKVGFKAEAVDEEGIWCPCTVKDIRKDSVIISCESSNVDWNRCMCNPHEIRNRTVFKGVPNCKAATP